jgi:hypothetical protein
MKNLDTSNYFPYGKWSSRVVPFRFFVLHSVVFWNLPASKFVISTTEVAVGWNFYFISVFFAFIRLRA